MKRNNYCLSIRRCGFVFLVGCMVWTMSHPLWSHAEQRQARERPLKRAIDGGGSCSQTPPPCQCLDSDGDGWDNCVDQCPFDPLKIEPGQCGCGVPDSESNTADNDGDSVINCLDACIDNPNVSSPPPGCCTCAWDGTSDDECVDPPGGCYPSSEDLCGWFLVEDGEEVAIPAHGTIDARHSQTANDPNTPLGVDQLFFVVEDHDGNATPDCLTIEELESNSPPVVVEISMVPINNFYRHVWITLNRPITPGTWTSVRWGIDDNDPLTDDYDYLDFGFLPGDVNASGSFNVGQSDDDLEAWDESFNAGSCTLPQCDINRDGLVDMSDRERLEQLIDSPALGQSLPPQPHSE